jgi:hypothetical protein
MVCWVHEELRNEWKRLVEQKVGANSSGYDSPTVLLYWQIEEHRTTCEVCRDDEAVSNMKERLGKPWS